MENDWKGPFQKHYAAFVSGAVSKAAEKIKPSLEADPMSIFDLEGTPKSNGVLDMPGHLGGKPIAARLVFLNALIENQDSELGARFIRAVNTPWRCEAEELLETGRGVRHMIFLKLWKEFEETRGELREAGLKMLQKVADGMKTRPIELEGMDGILIQPWPNFRK